MEMKAIARNSTASVQSLWRHHGAERNANQHEDRAHQQRWNQHRATG
jgi:hypothetical protein